MSKISDETIKLISERNITPTTRWFFVAEDYTMRFFTAVSLILSSLIVATIVCVFEHEDAVLCRYWDDAVANHILAPHYFWPFILALSVIAAGFNFRHTKSGYRYGEIFVLAGIVFLSVVLGLALVFTELDGTVHNFFSEQAVNMSIFLKG